MVSVNWWIMEGASSRVSSKTAVWRDQCVCVRVHLRRCVECSALWDALCPVIQVGGLRERGGLGAEPGGLVSGPVWNIAQATFFSGSQIPHLSPWMWDSGSAAPGAPRSNCPVLRKQEPVLCSSRREMAQGHKRASGPHTRLGFHPASPLTCRP